MGIQGLLPFLKEASEPIHIRKYKGYTVGIDSYCWIHRGAVACATQLAKGEPADHYVRYCLKYVNMLRALDIKPVMVFDGRNLPAKAGVEDSRRERRETYSKKGRQFLREGKASEARDCFVKCINVTPEMALNVMKAVRSLGVDCIVAPYEADAQLAYLEKNGFVQAVITEDSDLIAFGCKKVIVKLDLAGNCMDVDSSRLNVAMKIGEKFTPEKFRYMCIVAGCDYLASLPGIGIGKARKLFQLTANPDITQVIKRMATTLKMKSTTVTPEYQEGFVQANNTFLYQLAFDPQKKKLQPLTPYSPEVTPATLTYAGKYVDEVKAYQMALGNINFDTMERIADFNPMVNKPYDKKTPRHLLSIWHKDFQPGPGLGCLNQDHIEREVTKGKEITVEVKQRLIQKKRQRDEEEVGAPSDVQLSSMYTTTKGQLDGNQWMESQRVIPETPDKDVVEEEMKPSKRNRFATKLTSRNRANIVNSGEVVTSRFFQPKKLDVSSEKQQQIPNDKKLKIEEKENQRVSMNTSGLLEGIVDIEMEQEKQFKMEDDDDDIEDVIEIKLKETVSGSQSRQTHVTKSIDALQRFQRSSSASVLVKTERNLSSSSLSNSVKPRTALSSTHQSEDIPDSQKSVIEIESSQDSVCSTRSVDTCSQSSSLSSSQRQGTPRPRSAFSWSRKKELQGKDKDSKQPTQGTLSGFVFKPTHQSKPMPRQTAVGVQDGSLQGNSLSRRDSYEMPCSPVSQNSSSQLLRLSLTSSIPGSMDMLRLGEDVTFMDSQSSNLTESQNTSSITLTSDQTSQLIDNTDLEDVSPPIPPLPQLPLQIHLSNGEEEEEEKGEMMEGIRRTGLSRKRKKTFSSEEQSPGKIPSDVSSPDTDDVSLNSSTASSPSPAPALSSSSLQTTKHFGMATASQSNKDADSLRVGGRGATSCYFGGGEREMSQGVVRKKGMMQEEEEWENTPPGRGGVSPYKGRRNRNLSGKRHNQGPKAAFMNDENQQNSSNSEPKKQSAFLGQCKASGLSKKRRSSGKAKPDATPKGQTSLLAFMAKPKTKDPLISQKGVSPLSPNRANLCTDLTPETEGSLLSRQGRGFTTKRHIFE
ncbi:exonuclease 1 isoform X2 [Strongylocentrotus purpuratus]|uniref:Exonuclease 1 n=1 Tax=Strongylocentrotus purpuratus TaxID=7668 RepID=A0A7M7PP69_STRPU|nr:exonuclease 1 isoform X2 [Strongylocentrotus purpuratus]